jgi:hypothetical protein
MSAEVEALVAEFEEAVRADPEVARLSKRILREQRRLRRRSSDDAWTAYLLVESATNDRADHVLHLIALFMSRARTSGHTR